MHKGFITTRGDEIFVPLTDAEGPAGRSVSDVVLTGRLTLPQPDVDMLCDWSAAYDSSEPGIVEHAGPRTHLGQDESLSAIEAATLQWAASHGVEDLFSSAEITPLVCQGALFHTDALNFGEYLFCVVWLSDDVGLDLVFPNIETRIPLEFGTVILFDAAQPHGVVPRGRNTWNAAQYTAQVPDPTQHFVSIDVPFAFTALKHRMNIRLFPELPDPCPDLNVLSFGQQRVVVDQETGRWKLAAKPG